MLFESHTTHRNKKKTENEIMNKKLLEKNHSRCTQREGKKNCEREMEKKSTHIRSTEK